MKVAFFRLLDDHTWDSFVWELPAIADEVAKGSKVLAGYDDWESVPDDVFDQWVGQFIHEQLLTQCQHRRASFIGVLCKSPGPVCDQCGEPYFTGGVGINHHTSDEHPDGIDYDADRDHVPYGDHNQE